MKTKLYSPQELTNEKYREIKAVCGSDIVTLMTQCPYDWHNAERKTTDALGFGVAAHMMLLEPEEFNKQVVQIPDVSEALSTAPQIKAFCTSKGVKPKSTSNKSELIHLALQIDPGVKIADHMIAIHAEENKDKTIIKREDFEKCQAMRDRVFSKPKLKELLTGAFCEYSIITEIDGIPVRIRPDIITKSGGIIDYKTTRDCDPMRYADMAYRSGYFAKMALQHDAFCSHYGKPPAFTALLPQDKDRTNQCYLWPLSERQLEIGRAQYKPLMRLAWSCMESDVYPELITGEDNDFILNLEHSQWIDKQYD